MSSFGRPTSSYRENIPISETTGTGKVDFDFDVGTESSKTTPRGVESSSESNGLSNISSLPTTSRQQHPPSGIALQLARARANQLDATPYISIHRATDDDVPDLNRLESQQRPPPIKNYSYDSMIPIETTPLLSSPPPARAPIPSSYSSISNHGSAFFPDPPPSPTIGTKLLGAINQTRKLKHREVWKNLGTTFLSSLPAVIIGLLLNILDGVSCLLFFGIMYHNSCLLLH